MKRMYIKKTFKDLHFIAYVCRCKKCKTENFYSSLSSYAGEWDAVVECGNWGAIVVFDLREIPEAWDAFYGVLPLGYEMYNEEEKKEFLNVK
jgi:hypothetical protein